MMNTKIISKIALLLCISLISSCGMQGNPKQEIQDTISAMIKLIDEKKGQELLDTYADLSDMKRGNVEDVSDKNLAQLKTYLQKAETLEPTFSNDDTQATFKDSSFPRPIRFIKNEGKWLMKD